MIENATPLKPYDDRTPDYRDLAGTHAYSQRALERMLIEGPDQPNWRPKNALCHAYYDGKQLSQEQELMIQEERLDKRVTNLIRPVINSVLGQEAKSRSDVKLEADDESFMDVVDALSPVLKEAERETCAHMAVSNAYGGMTKGGLGWVEVARNADPLDYRYRVQDVPVEEIWWDWTNQKGVTLDGARWVVRMRWVDLDELEAQVHKKHHAVLKRLANGWSEDDNTETFTLGEPDRFVIDSWEAARRFSIARRDWIDTGRKMVKVYEVWYRVPVMAVVMRMPGGRFIEYDEKDPRHQIAVARGLVKVSKRPSMQFRKAFYAGPYRLSDEGTKRRRFPFIPFFAFRDNADGSPYGLIDGMLAPQDEYNERRLRLQWMLKAKQIDIDKDSLDTDYNTVADVTENAMRPDMVTVLKADRKFENAVRRRNDLTLVSEQVDVMRDSRELIQATAGRYASQLGSAQVQSGIANNLLIEQGEQSMGEMNDNYLWARRCVFEELTAQICEDHDDKDMQMLVGEGGSRRVVVLNTFDPETNAPKNVVKEARVRAALGDVPSSPAYRQQMQQHVAQIITALAPIPEAVRVLAPAYVEGSDIPDRKNVADDMRRAMNLPTPGDRQGREAAQAAQQQAMQQQQQQAAQLADAEVQGKAAQAELHAAQARKTAAEADELIARLRSQSQLAEQEARTQKLHSAADLDRARVVQIGAQMSDSMRASDNEAEQREFDRAQAQPAANDERAIDDAIAEARA